ncbi:MAG: PASTA domain-containing protein, partial [Actinobacteria bacterium]
MIAVLALSLVVIAQTGCNRGPTVPDIVGMRQADAVRALEDAGYKLGDVSAVATTGVELG